MSPLLVIGFVMLAYLVGLIYGWRATVRHYQRRDRERWR